MMIQSVLAEKIRRPWVVQRATEAQDGPLARRGIPFQGAVRFHFGGEVHHVLWGRHGRTALEPARVIENIHGTR